MSIKTIRILLGRQAGQERRKVTGCVIRIQTWNQFAVKICLVYMMMMVVVKSGGIVLSKPLYLLIGSPHSGINSSENFKLMPELKSEARDAIDMHSTGIDRENHMSSKLTAATAATANYDLTLFLQDLTLIPSIRFTTILSSNGLPAIRLATLQFTILANLSF